MPKSVSKDQDEAEPQEPGRAPKAVFETMNGLRGLAAIIVLMGHAQSWFSAMSPVMGYLCVDLFFVLSGFVIAHSYENRFAEGMTVWRFLRIRFIRLYPLYLLGVVITLVVPIISIIAHHGLIRTNSGWLSSFPFSIVMLPTPLFLQANIQWEHLYPLNVPAWSLFFEILINAIYVATWRYWSIRNILVVMAVSALFMLSAPTFHGDGGARWEQFHFGLVRVAYSFPSGVLLFRMNRMLGGVIPRIDPILLLILFPLLLVLPAGWVWQFCIFVGFPILVAFAAHSEPNRLVRPIFSALGGVSYAIYAIHMPLMELGIAIMSKLHLVIDPQIVGFFFLVIVISACLFLDRFFDAPARRLLTGILIPKSANAG